MIDIIIAIASAGSRGAVLLYLEAISQCITNEAQFTSRMVICRCNSCQSTYRQYTLLSIIRYFCTSLMLRSSPPLLCSSAPFLAANFPLLRLLWAKNVEMVSRYLGRNRHSSILLIVEKYPDWSIDVPRSSPNHRINVSNQLNTMIALHQADTNAGYSNEDMFAWKLFLQMDSANNTNDKRAQDNVVIQSLAWSSCPIGELPQDQPSHRSREIVY